MNPYACYYALFAGWAITFVLLYNVKVLSDRQIRLKIPAWDPFTTILQFFSLFIGACSGMLTVIGTVAVTVGGASCTA